MRCVILPLGLVMAWAGIVRAEEQTNLFESPRVSGRGRAHVAAYDSDDATRFNPATLAEPKLKFQLRPAQFDLFVGENSINLINDLVKVSSSSNSGGDGMVQFLSQLDFGQRLYGRGQLGLLAMRFGGFELSPFFVGEMAFDLHNPVLPGAAWRIDSVAGMGMSYGWFWRPNLAVGVTVRPLHRWYTSSEMGLVDILDYTSSSGSDKASDTFRLLSGWGVGVDTGLIWLPTPTTRVGVTVLNVGDTGYFQDTGEQPPNIQQTINVGALHRAALGKWNWDWYLDGQGLMNRGGINLVRLIHGGTELGYRLWSRDNDLGLVAGLNEGYTTYGLFADLWLLRLDVTNYAVEVGHYPGQIIDRRWGATLRTSMTF